MTKGISAAEQLFTLSYDVTTRQLSLHALGRAGSVTTFGHMTPHRWTHVTLHKHGSAISIFIHGIRDAHKGIKGGMQEPASPLYIGAVPWGSAACHLPFLLDDLRVYSRALSNFEIQADSFPSLGAVEPAFAHLGCMKCKYGAAEGSCGSGSHLCYQSELNAGGYQVIRAMGWGDWKTPIWVNADGSNPSQGPNERLGVCCS